MSKPRHGVEMERLPGITHNTSAVSDHRATYRRYIPGTGPRLRPITLVPRADSTAYIRAEDLVPREYASDGKVHVVYLIGWTDLPAARASVDAEYILDYVSAREYERWNAERAEEIEEEERRREEEENLQLVADHISAEQLALGIVLRNGTTRPTTDSDSTEPLPKTKRKPGRPAKAPRPRALSLSQPTPVEALGLEATEPDTSNDDDKAIRRQLGEAVDRGEFNSISTSPEPPPKRRRTASPAIGNGSDSQGDAPKKITAVPVPRIPTRPSLLSRVASMPATSASGNASDISSTSSFRSISAQNLKAPPSSFTSVAQPPPPPVQSKQKSPQQKAPREKMPKVKASKEKTPKEKTTKSSTPKEIPPDLVRYDPNEIFRVKRLVETRIFEDEEGNRVRHFLVLWKGNWPPDQNPTWEPEENIPKAMARKFLLTEAANIGMDGTFERHNPRKPSPRRPPVPSSVLEAFTGEADADDGDSHIRREHLPPSDVDDREDLLMVTDEPTPRRDSYQPSSFRWEMAMGRRFGADEGMTG